MSSSPRRPFNLLDAMVLLAATAAGFAIARGMPGKLWGSNTEPYESEVLLQIARWTVVCVPFLAAWTIALFLLPFLSRRLRPSFIGLLHQPGAAACTAAALAIIIETVNVMALSLMHSNPLSVYKGPVSHVLLFTLTHDMVCELGMPGLAVIVAWLVLASNGRWQPETNWLDLAGRLMGLVWVVLMAFRPWLSSMLHS